MKALEGFSRDWKSMREDLNFLSTSRAKGGGFGGSAVAV